MLKISVKRLMDVCCLIKYRLVYKGEKIAFLSKDPLAVTNFFEIINGNAKADNGNLSGALLLQKHTCLWRTVNFLRETYTY